MANSIGHWIRTRVKLVIAAMERALKRQAKWNYAEILKQWTNSNIRTLSDVKASEEAFKRQNSLKRAGNGQGGSDYGSSKRSDDEDFEYIGL